MMRGADTWAVAVRLPDGSIVSSVQPVASWSQRYREIPVVRGVAALGESLALGYRALAWSADRQLAAVDPSANVPTDANEALSSRAVRATMLTAMAFFTVVFLVAPALAGRSLAHRLPLPFPVAEAIVRLGFFLGYLLLIGRVRDIRRVFEYHGAEHKAIAAYERGVPLTPARPRGAGRAGRPSRAGSPWCRPRPTRHRPAGARPWDRRRGRGDRCAQRWTDHPRPHQSRAGSGAIRV